MAPHPNFGSISSLPVMSPKAQFTSWTPESLLNPKGTSTMRKSTPSLVSDSPQMPVFEFESAASPAKFAQSDVTLKQQSDTSSQSSTQTTNGMGSMIENMNRLQHRSAHPPAKRRRVDENAQNEEDNKGTPVTQFSRNSSGMLGQYIKEKRENGNLPLDLTAEQAVDLTGDDASTVALERSKLGQSDEEVCFGMVHGAGVNCHIVPSPKPGMQAIGGPSYWPQVKTLLKRKTKQGNTVIPVVDHTRVQFGQIDAKTARVLAPLLDAYQIGMRTDCIIATRRKSPDEQEGGRISRWYPVQLMLYGKARFAKAVGNHMIKGGLNLLSPPRCEAGIRYLNPMTGREAVNNRNGPVDVAAAAERSRRDQKYLYRPAIASRTVEEVRSDVQTIFNSLGGTDELPEVEAGEMLITALKKHQKQGLGFMLGREDAQAPFDDKSLWKRHIGKGREMLYRHAITGQVLDHEPERTLGGLLADDMGLGKTLSILALITHPNQPTEEWLQSKPYRPLVPVEKPSLIPRPDQIPLTPVKFMSKATLLICPLSTMSNWEDQINQHLDPDSRLKYYIYHGQGRNRNAEELAEYDLVMTTYGSVSKDLKPKAKDKLRGPAPLEQIGWFRVVLDEAHMIREPSTLQFKAICRLQSSRRWAVTGTPVQNKLEDLGSLLAFLRLKPFDDRNRFQQHIIKPLKDCDPEIIPKLRILVDTITIRRSKDKIHLPKRNDSIVYLDFSPEERDVYDVFEKVARDKVDLLTGGQERITGGKTFMHILRTITLLRRLCAHGKELLTNEDLRVLDGRTKESAIDLDSDESRLEAPTLSEEAAYENVGLMLETSHDICSACERKLGRDDSAEIDSEKQEDTLGYMTDCLHLLCTKCIKDYKDDNTKAGHKKSGSGICPWCRHPVRFGSIKLSISRARKEYEARNNDKVLSQKDRKVNKPSLESYLGPHTKTRWLVGQLLEHKAKSTANPDSPPYKSVIFSCWTSHLDLIELALDAASIAYVRLDGSMSRPARSSVMAQFRDDNNVQVILVSIAAGGMGLNLTAANYAFVMEPQFNPAMEAQAVDRVHRMGQEREVWCYRLIMAKSFEEKMLEMGENKRELAKFSMDRDGGGRGKDLGPEQRMQKIRNLFK